MALRFDRVVEPIPTERRENFIILMYDLDDEACRNLLARSRFGRVALDDDEGPVAFPVNAFFAHDRVLLRTAPGSAIDRAAERRQPVSYEADHTDPVAESGWSVIVRGRIARLVDPALGAELADSDVEPWAPGSRDLWIEIPADRITGRMIRRQRRAPADAPRPHLPPG